MSTTGHENEVVRVSGLKATMRKGGNLGIPNKAACSTTAATAAKTITLKEGFALEDGAMVLVTFANAITVANATLAVTYPNAAGTQQTTAAKPIKYGGAALAANLIKANMMVMLRYYTDGENSANDCWNVVGDLTPSGFKITHNNTTGADEFEAIGSATLVHDTSTGADKFVF